MHTIPADKMAQNLIDRHGITGAMKYVGARLEETVGTNMTNGDDVSDYWGMMYTRLDLILLNQLTDLDKKHPEGGAPPNE